MRFLKQTLVAAAVCALAMQAHAQQPGATDPLSVVKAYMKAWSALAEMRGINDMDITATANEASKYFDPEVEYLDSTVGKPQVGVVVARDNVIKPFLTSYPNARWEMVGAPKVDGETVEFDWRFTGNAWGPYIVDPTCAGKGDRLDLAGHSRIVVKAGLITYQNDSYDDKVIPDQMRRTAQACTAQKGEETKKADAAKSLAVTGNFALVSDYMFRGISVSNRHPAVQGGIDLAHPNGFYASVWASNVGAAYRNGGGQELDLLTGMKFDLGNAATLDLGLAFYNYPGAKYPSFTGDGSIVGYNTQELKIGYNQDVFNATLWVGLNRRWSGIDFDNAFAKTSTRYSTYAELNYNPQLTDTLTLNLHAGHQTVRHSSNASFNDFKLGLTSDAGFMGMPGWLAGAAVVYNDGKTAVWNFPNPDATAVAAKKAVGSTVLLSLTKYF